MAGRSPSPCAVEEALCPARSELPATAATSPPSLVVRFAENLKNIVKIANPSELMRVALLLLCLASTAAAACPPWKGDSVVFGSAGEPLCAKHREPLLKTTV